MLSIIFRRIQCFAVIALAQLAAINATEVAAQTAPVIGYVANENADAERLAAFKKGLTDLGYVEGTNLKIEYRYAKLDHEYDAVMAELVSRKVNVIVAANAAAAPAAAKATHTIPIVLAGVNDPVGLGVVDSLQRPGRNVSGTTIYAPHLIGERVRILSRMAPSVDRVGVVMNGNNKNNAPQVELLIVTAKELGIQVEPMDIRSPADVESAVNGAIGSGVKGFFNCVDTFINSQRFTIAKLVAQSRRPAIYTDKEYVLAGGLMALGVGHLEGYYGAAKYVDQMLRGASPADLPIAPPTTLSFSISRSALQDIGVALPKEISERVTEWLP